VTRRLRTAYQRLSPFIRLEGTMRVIFVFPSLLVTGAALALQAVAIAGGYTYRARQNNLYLKRLDANGGMVRVAATPETKIRPGDTVEIKGRYF
jgi:hypothetical protein